MQKENPTYYAVIPANVRYDKRLNGNQKLLFGEISALSNKTGECWANNAYFAELYDVSATSISLWIAELIKCGYLESRLVYKGGTKEILNRYLKILIYPPQENLNTPPQENLKDNNTSSNTTSIIIPEKKVFSDFAKIKVPKAAKVKTQKPFNLKEELAEMEFIPGSEMDHLASYIWYKDLKVESMAEMVVLKKRNGKILKDLAAYTRPRVQEAMIKLNKKAEHEENKNGELNVVEWTLETVLKTLQK